jgi:hypothetical protein
MVFRRVASHGQDAITVSDIDPVVGHCAASERLCQSRNCCAVSDTGLMFDVDKAERPHHGLQQPAFLIVKGCAPDVCDTIGTVDYLALVVCDGETLITALFDPPGDPSQGPVP